MLFLKNKDLNSRQIYNRVEKIRLIKKFILANLLSRINYKSSREKQFFFYLVSKYNLNSLSKTKITRRCVLTNRSRGTIRPYNISRLSFKHLTKIGFLSEYKKAIW
jgi:ribosomal protein S14